MLGPCLAAGVVGLDGAPIVGGVVGPVGGDVAGVRTTDLLAFDEMTPYGASLSIGMICAAKDRGRERNEEKDASGHDTVGSGYHAS